MKAPTSQGIGNLLRYSKTQTGILAEASEGHIRIILYSPLIARITITRGNEFDDFSYAVVASPEKVAFECVENQSGVQMVTSDLRVIIHRSPISVRFETLDGKVINEDDPGLGTSWIGEQVTTYKKLQEGERFIGLGEKTGPLDRRGHAYQNWNTDAYGYHSGSDPLYCSTPFYTGVHHDQVYGIYFDNSHKTFFSFGASNDRFASFAADTGPMDYYFIGGTHVTKILEGYTWLTGRMELPPLWSLGYQQCRYSYYPESEVKAVATAFRERDIPADVIVLDIHYMDKYKIFTWDDKNFPDPEGLIQFLRQKGFHAVVMCDPGIRIEDGYFPYDDGKKRDVFLKYPDGGYYSGQVWPGWCHFPDFSKSATRSWWTDQLEKYTSIGLDGFWNDMNEIATWGHSLPENIEFDLDGTGGTTRRGRNLYGFLMARSTYEGARKLLNGRRPFNLTRSGFSGVQRYAAVWTGDNVSYDEHMLLGVRLVNSLGLTGVAFAGYDAGGFVGEGNSRLFARWISTAALSPFFRTHTMINTRDSEPWSYGEEVEQISRNFIKFRYQLMPYIYSLFYRSSATGEPVQRSLAVDHPFEPRVYAAAFHNQYLFGPFILVAPLESSKEIAKVYLPPGDWYSVYDGKKYSGASEVYVESPIQRLPVFIRNGALIPMKEAGINTESGKENLLLHIYHGPAPSEFTHYEDDGDTYQYQQGQFARRTITFDPARRTLVLHKTEGSFKPSWKKISFILHGFEAVGELRTGSSRISVTGIDHSFFSPLEKYDPINEPESMGSEKVQRAEIEFSSAETVINW